jgi:hypothetical protein
MRLGREAVKGILDHHDVDLRTTGHANMKTRKPQVDEVLYEVRDMFSNGWDSRSFGTLVGRVQLEDKINWVLIRKREHALKAAHQCVVPSLTRAIVMCLVKAGEYVIKANRASRKKVGLEVKGVDCGGISCRHPESGNKK